MYTLDMEQELRPHWTSLQHKLRQEEGDGMLITTNVNLFYLSGRIFNGVIYMPAEGDPLFFVRRPVGLQGDRVIYIRKPEEIPAELFRRGIPSPKALFLESDVISYSEHLRYEAAMGHPVMVKNGSGLLRSVRAVKTPYEIELLRRSGILHAKAYERIPSLYHAGMSDVDLSIELERELRRMGSLGLFRISGQSMEIFMGSLLAGDNADTPSPYDFAMGGSGQNASLPIGGNGTVLREGMSVMVDMGGNFTGYMTDMTRVFSIGRLPEEAYRAHETALEIQRQVQQIARPGTPASDLYRIAVDTASETGLSGFFMGHRQQAGFVGHGIGLEINELPVLSERSKDILAPGMVFALEPKFVVPSVGAVGIENSFLVTDSGVEKLTLCREEIVSLEG